MTEPWIRVHANLAGKPVTFRAAEALGVGTHEAIGLLVTFWGAVSQHSVNGQVGAFSDAQIEAWAGWRRKRGRFATFIRTAHLDADGRVNEWDEYAGKLEARRATERERLRKKREDVAQQTANSTHDVAQQSSNGCKMLTPARAVRNDTKRITTTATTSRRQPRVEGNGAEKSTWLSPICAVWETQFGGGSFAGVAGQAAKALAPLVKAGNPPESIAQRLTIYLAKTDAKYVNVGKFAHTYGEWVAKRMTDDNGIPNANALKAWNEP